MRNKLVLILLLLAVVCRGQKLVLLANLSKNFTAYRSNSFFVVGDSSYYYLGKTKSAFNLNIILPAIAYEFKNQSRISITPHFFREKVNFLDSAEYNDYKGWPPLTALAGEKQGFYDGVGSIEIITKFRRLDVNYEYNLLRQKQSSLCVFGGLSYSWRGLKHKFQYNSQNLELKEGDERLELFKKYKNSGSFISFNAGFAYRFKRLQVLLGGGSSLFSINNKEKIIKRQVFLQTGIRYDIFKKTYVVNQLRNNSTLNTELNIIKRFDLSFHARGNLLTKFKQTGAQSYFYYEAGPGKDNYAFVFSQKPAIKVSPEIALQSKWYLKNNALAIRASLAGQTFRATYSNAVYKISGSKTVTEDEEDFFIRTMYMLGIEKHVQIKKELNAFFAFDLGLNNFFTSDFNSLVENLSIRVEDDSDLLKNKLITDVQCGLAYKRATAYLSYSIVPGRFSNSGEYVLKNLQQVKIGVSYALIERRRNAK